MARSRFYCSVSDEQEQSKKSVTLNIIILGESGVGKTSILRSFANKLNNYKPESTISPEMHGHTCIIDETHVKIYFWDTAGQERHRASMPLMYYRKADGCILVYDVTNLPSFTALDTIRDEVLLWSSPIDPELFPFILLGNKVELIHADPTEKKVSDRRVDNWCHGDRKIPSYLVSAVKDINIKPAFDEISNLAFQYYKATRATTQGISINLKYLDTNARSSGNSPTVLIAHGSPGNYEEFSGLIERLDARGYRVIVPNFPGISFTDATRTFYHSTEEKCELLTDFLTAINVPSVDLAVMHSSGTYPTMKMWYDDPESIRSLMWINPAGHRLMKAMKPEWIFANLARLNMLPVGRKFYDKYAYSMAKVANIKFATSKERAINAVISFLTMHMAGVERLALYAQNLKVRRTPTSYIFADKDKLVDNEIYLELVDMLGASSRNINTVQEGELIKPAEHELDWLRIFRLEGGGHYAFKSFYSLLDKEANRLIEQVYSKREAEQRSRKINLEV